MTNGIGAEAYSSMSVGSSGMNTCCQAKGYRIAMAAWTQEDRALTSSATRTIRRSHRMADHSRRKLRGPRRTYIGYRGCVYRVWLCTAFGGRERGEKRCAIQWKALSTLHAGV